MRKIVLLLVLLFAFPLVVMAQDLPKAELFGGYSFVRFEKENLNGWNGSIAGNVNKYLAFVADSTGVYKSVSGTTSGMSYQGKISMYSFLFGPRFSSHASSKYTPFAHALFGLGRMNGSGTAASSGNQVFNSSSSVNGFSMALGGGLDVNVKRQIALRIAQVDYLRIRANGITGTGVRISCGLVFRLGAKK